MGIRTIPVKKDSLAWMAAGILFVAGVGLADVWTGRELAFSLFYLIPVVLVTWYAGRAFGLAIDLLSAAAWFAADEMAGQTYSHRLIYYWNATVRLGFFVVVTLLLATLKELEREKVTARVDLLTGAANRRVFFEAIQRELDRFRRYGSPFSIAYVDIDDFKRVNDRWGHRAGDQLLRSVAERTREHLRKTDMIGRLGGDEFALLLPEADQEAAWGMVARLQAALSDAMRRDGWQVTFSIGVLTCACPDTTVDELVSRADELMYSVKKRGKNGVAYAVNAV